jgi:hypothetical protein
MSWRLCTLAAVSLMPLSVNAAEMPKEGNDVFTAVWVATSSTIQQGNHSVTTYELTGVARNDRGGPMFNLFGQHCVGIVDSVGSDRRDEGTCTYTDKDGDQIFQPYAGKTVDGHGTAELAGGTGKFAGITGTIDWFDSPPIKADDKAFRGAVLHKVTWKLP